MEEFHAARQDVLRLERELAAARSEQYAVPCDFPVRWDVGAPLPFLLCNDNRTFLTFHVAQPDPDWDGTSIRVVDPASPNATSLCLVTFKHCSSVKFGHPNDEVLAGHPLADRGLEGYTAQIVMNSRWLEEIATTNSVHPSDDPATWRSLNHYVFWFHDSTFECIAESYETELTNESMGDLLNRIQAQLLE